jgi:deazaflavin-dependent oxidoreductase (nitroreductase family)
MNEDLLRRIFKYLNVFMVFMWKIGLAKFLNIWPKVLGQYLVITHYGRNSGNKYYTPVNFSEIDGDIYCTSGFGIQSDWYKNVLHNPDIEIWTKNGWWHARAEDISNHPQRIAIMRKVLMASGFAAPLFGLNPSQMDDEILFEVTKDYRILRLERMTAQTGNNGPGEYSWIWQLISFFLFFLLISKKKDK